MLIRNAFLVLGLFTLAGCSSPGPMQTTQGPMNTPVFAPIVFDLVKDGSDDIFFKEKALMYESKRGTVEGTFFITENGVYMAEWDRDGYKYHLVYRQLFKDLDNVFEGVVKGLLWGEESVLVLRDKYGNLTQFYLDGRNVARSIISEHFNAQ